MISKELFEDVQKFIAENYIENDFAYESACSDFMEESEFCMPVQAEKVVFPDEPPLTVRDFSANEETKKPESNFNSTSKIRLPVKRSTALTGAVCNVDDFFSQSDKTLNFQNSLQQLIAERNLENSAVYTKAFIDRKFFSKIISTKNYVPKKITVMALGLVLELPLSEYETFLASAGYAFMPSSRFDLIVKYCVINQIHNLMEVDMILDSYGECCFASE